MADAGTTPQLRESDRSHTDRCPPVFHKGRYNVAVATMIGSASYKRLLGQGTETEGSAGLLGPIDTDRTRTDFK
jgi:hypothetical protein